MFSMTSLVPHISVDIVDIGANPVDGRPRYACLLDQGRGRVVGFEPNPEALARLVSAKGPSETYLPYALGDGARHVLNLCHASGMSSILEPNRAVLDCFHGFPDWSRIAGRIEVDTVRLDDVAEIGNIDLIQIDVQGYELEVLRNGVEKLRSAVVVHTEVEFLQMYRDQPLFAEVDAFMRQQGFLLHCFSSFFTRTFRPLLLDQDIYKGLNQALWADAVFVRDFTRFDLLSSEKLMKVALILHDLYGSFDLALRALSAVDQRQGSDLGARYMRLFG
jgi:FkbM family methyltransferase